MTKNKQSTGSFYKVRRLITVLEKCNGKTTLGDSNALISPKAIKILMYIGLLLLTGALFTGCYFLYPLIAPIIPLRNITDTLMLIVMLISFILTVKNLVTVLYTADDLPVLLPMPFSAGQIVTAKLAVSSRFPLILSLILVNSVCLGFGIRAGADAAYIIGTVLSSVLIPITTLAIVTILVVLIFRVFGFIRNRDITMVLGGVFTLALTVAYIFVSNQLTGSKSGEAAATVFSTMASVTNGFPNISFMSNFMFNGDIVGLLISICITAAVVLVAMLAVKLFYLSTALTMQNTGTNKKAVTKDELTGNKKTSARKALTSYESKSTRRNPAYMIYGFGMSFIWPLFVVLPLVLGNNSILDKVTYPFDLRVSLVGALFVGVIASCFACGLNILAASAFSREGVNFSMLKALPIDFADYYKSKRNFALLICSLGSIVYILILGVFCVAAGVVPIVQCWVFLFSALISFLLDLTLINFMLLHNSRKPYFTWDSETEISRKLTWVNIVTFIVGLVFEIILLVTLALSSLLSGPNSDSFSGIATTVTLITTAVLGIGIPVLAFIVNKFAVKKAEKNLMGTN